MKFRSADGNKLALERYFGQPVDTKLALERHFGRLDDAKLAVERHFGPPDGDKWALERRFGALERFNYLGIFDDPKPRREIYG